MQYQVQDSQMTFGGKPLSRQDVLEASRVVLPLEESEGETLMTQVSVEIHLHPQDSTEEPKPSETREEMSRAQAVAVTVPHGKDQAGGQDDEDFEVQLGKYYLDEARQQDLMESVEHNNQVCPGLWHTYVERAKYGRCYNDAKEGPLEGKTMEEQTDRWIGKGITSEIIKLVGKDIRAKKTLKSAAKRYCKLDVTMPMPVMTLGEIPPEEPVRAKKKKKKVKTKDQEDDE